MVISKKIISQNLKTGDIVSAFSNLLHLSKKCDSYTYNLVEFHFGQYAECVISIEKSENRFDQIKSLTRFPMELILILENHVLDEWSVDIKGLMHSEDIHKLMHIISGDEKNETSIKEGTILFLAANPKDSEPLRLAEEIAEIEGALEASSYKLNLEQKLVVTKKSLEKYMNKYEPDILHFSGHGSSKGEIILNDGDNYSTKLSALALGKFLGHFKKNLKCVVLNACYTDIQASEIHKHIPFVIGMIHEANNEAAKYFSGSFYGALGEGNDVETAFKKAKDAPTLDGFEDDFKPILLN